MKKLARRLWSWLKELFGLGPRCVSCRQVRPLESSGLCGECARDRQERDL